MIQILKAGKILDPLPYYTPFLNLYSLYNTKLLDLQIPLFNLQWPDKYLYLSPILWSKTILIASWVREKGVNDPSYKMRTIFLMSLALSVPIFNKKSHRTQAVETFEVLPNFESFHRSCRMRFFVENWHTKSKGHKKKCSHFIRRRVRPLPLPPS